MIKIHVIKYQLAQAMQLDYYFVTSEFLLYDLWLFMKD